MDHFIDLHVRFRSFVDFENQKIYQDSTGFFTREILETKFSYFCVYKLHSVQTNRFKRIKSLWKILIRYFRIKIGTLYVSTLDFWSLRTQNNSCIVLPSFDDIRVRV